MAVAVLVTAQIAMAQAPPSPGSPVPPTASQPDPRPCEPSRLPAQPQEGGRAGPTTGAAPSLSDQLARGEGVLCPPRGIDPEIVAPTPDVGRMPVIPPPGSPGGDPTIRPK